MSRTHGITVIIIIVILEIENFSGETAQTRFKKDLLKRPEARLDINSKIVSSIPEKHIADREIPNEAHPKRNRDPSFGNQHLDPQLGLLTQRSKQVVSTGGELGFPIAVL